MLEGMNKYGSPPPHYRLGFSLVLAVGRSYARPHTIVTSTPTAAPKHRPLAAIFSTASVSWLLCFLVLNQARELFLMFALEPGVFLRPLAPVLFP